MKFILIVSLCCLAACAWAADIVTMPTANQLKQGEIDVAYYYLALDLPDGAPQSVHYQTLYVGLTDWLEVDAHRADVDKDKTSVVLVGSIKLLSESPTKPDLVIGVRNFTGTATTNNPMGLEASKDASYYITAAKTFFLQPAKPGPPLVRVHLGLGTEDNTLLGESRHKGLFGGLQALFVPTVGGIVQYDGRDLITGLTYMPKGTDLTLKFGTYGDHKWVGVSWLHKGF
ncbi:MAG: hypothetical protein ACYDBB_26390 [Armatimonadota bacterium]